MADTTPSARQDADPNPTVAWARLRDTVHTDEQRACLAAASRQADRTWITLHQQAGPEAGPIPPRNAVWHRIALAGYQLLTDSGAYRHLAQHRPWACAAAEPLIAAWLSQPAHPTPHGTSEGRSVTVGRRLGVDDGMWAINADTQLDHLSTLVDAAQDAHVFGVPDHRIGLVRDTHHHHHDGDTVVRLVVDAPRGPALASRPLHLAALIEPDSTGVDAATVVLRRVADIVTDVFTAQADAVWNAPPPMPVDHRAATPTGHPFPHLDQPAAAPTTVVPGPSVPARGDTPDRGRTRRPR